MSRNRLIERTIAGLLLIVVSVIPARAIGGQGVNASLIKLTYRCGNWFRIRNLNTVDVSVQYSVYRTSETGPVTLPAAPASIGYGDTWIQTQNTGAVVITYNGSRVAEKPNGGAACAVAASKGQWTDTLSWPNMAIASAVLPNGNVISYGREFAAENPPHYVIPPGRHDGVPYMWNPSTGAFTNIDTPAHDDLFCSGLAIMADGSVIIMGGNAVFDQVGQRFNRKFNYLTNTWTLGANMAAGRWYPTVTTMSNGDVFVISGADTNQAINPIPEVYHHASNTYTELTGLNNAVNFWVWMFVAPNGNLFYSGDGAATYFISTSGTGSTVGGFIWTQSELIRSYGSAVMYDAGKILIVGGGNPGATSAEIIDLTQGSPAWQYTASMNFARRQMNALILANGQVMASGGSSGPDFNPATNIVYTPEIWDPVVQTWTEMANYKMPRLYHSETLLLLDGRVLSVGGGQPAATGLNDNFNAEIYSPTYLFNPDGSAVTASRPIITSAPTQVTYNQNFSVNVQNVAAGTAKVLWTRLNAVTHAIDMNQRLNHLSATQSGNTLTVTSPANANLAPPGHYILWVLNANGVPSVGSVIQIQ
jgi:hypothetical protein